MSDKTNKIIDDLSYFLGSESVQIINGLHQLLTDTLVLVVQQNEIINGDELTNLETQANTIEQLTRERDELIKFAEFCSHLGSQICCSTLEDAADAILAKHSGEEK